MAKPLDIPLQISEEQKDILRLNDVGMGNEFALEIVDRYAFEHDPDGKLYDWFMRQTWDMLGRPVTYSSYLPEHPTYRTLPRSALSAYGHYLITCIISNPRMD